MPADDKAARYAHLLNPIRDLAQNWNIDVARDLEDYLEDLESIEISFDGGITSLNFAEAARLIQVRFGPSLIVGTASKINTA